MRHGITNKPNSVKLLNSNQIMTMKYKIFTMGMLAGALALQSCSQEELEKGTPLEPGAEIQFGATLPDDDMTRTYYDSKDVADPNATAWKIYWNTPDKGLDKIFIYSPEAAEGRNQAIYTVNATADKQQAAAEVTRVGDAGIQAGSNTQQTYNFYAMYPASAVKGRATGNTISGTLSGDQQVTLDPTTANANVKKMTSDMNNCLMIAKETGVKLENGKKVPIQFKPFVSTLDITVKGPNNGETVKITSVEISTSSQNGYLTGDFSYDFNAANIQTGLTVPSATASQSIVVYTDDGSGNGISLTGEQTLQFQAFVLPDANVKNLKIRVNGTTDASYYWDKTLNMANTDISGCNVLKVTLPKLNMELKNFNFGTWLSQLNSNTYLSEISLPGSALSWCSTKYTNTLDEYRETQTLTIAEQFAAGVRVFQAHCWLNPAVSSVDNKAPSLHLAVATSNRAYDTGVKLYDVVKVLTNEMKTNHAREFCVLMLSDYNTSSTTGYNYSYEQFYTRIKELSDELAAQGLLAEKVDENTTIDDVRGKVILKIQLNNNGQSSWSKLDGSKVLLNTYGQGADSNVWYSQLTFGASSIATGGTDASGSISSWPMSFIYTEQANAAELHNLTWRIKPEVITALQNNISAFRTNYTNNKSKHNVFGMSYLGGNGGGGRYSEITTLELTTSLITTWENAWGTNNDCPYGWVMFNRIGNSTVNNAIQTVINQNGMGTFKPAVKPATKSALNDATSKNKGPLFGKRRR